jgi:hypothetical protein
LKGDKGCDGTIRLSGEVLSLLSLFLSLPLSVRYLEYLEVPYVGKGGMKMEDIKGQGEHDK